jgi:ABC-type multidrug transport system ATPase subunit
VPLSATPLFQLRELRKSYGSQSVLKSLDLDFFGGDFVLLLGANGSGKSTLLRICAGLIRPDGGRIEGDIGQIAHAGHALFLYAGLTVRENLDLASKLLGRPSENLDEYLTEWSMLSHAGKKISELSKGLQYRTSICRALLGGAAFTFLDEPTSSLDEASNTLLLEKLRARAERNPDSFTVIATHDLARLKSSANRVVVLQDGQVAFDSRRKEEALSRAEAIEAAINFYLEINR